MFNEGCDITKSRKATYTKLETIETFMFYLDFSQRLSIQTNYVVHIFIIILSHKTSLN